MRSERGASLVFVLVGIAVIGGIVAAAISSYGDLVSIRRFLRAGMGQTEVSTSIEDLIRTQVGAHLNASCGGAPATFFPGGSLGNYGTINRLFGAPPMAATPEVAQAAARCANPSHNNMIPVAGGTSYFFCIQYTRAAGFNRGNVGESFLGAERAFGEVFVRLMNPTTNNPAGCAQPSTNAPIAAAVFYAIYWPVSLDNGTRVRFQKHESFFLSTY